MRRLISTSAFFLCAGCSLHYAGVKTEQKLASPLEERACIIDALKEMDGVEYNRSFSDSRPKSGVYPEGVVREKIHTFSYDIQGMQQPKDRTAYITLTEDYKDSTLLNVHYQNQFRELSKKVSEDDRAVARAALTKVDEAVRAQCHIETLQPEVTEFQ